MSSMDEWGSIMIEKPFSPDQRSASGEEAAIQTGKLDAIYGDDLITDAKAIIDALEGG